MKIGGLIARFLGGTNLPTCASTESDLFVDIDGTTFREKRPGKWVWMYNNKGELAPTPVKLIGSIDLDFNKGVNPVHDSLAVSRLVDQINSARVPGLSQVYIPGNVPVGIIDRNIKIISAGYEHITLDRKVYSWDIYLGRPINKVFKTSP